MTSGRVWRGKFSGGSVLNGNRVGNFLQGRGRVLVRTSPQVQIESSPQAIAESSFAGKASVSPRAP